METIGNAGGFFVLNGSVSKYDGSVENSFKGNSKRIPLVKN